MQSDMRGNGKIVAKAIAEEFEWLEEVKEKMHFMVSLSLKPRWK